MLAALVRWLEGLAQQSPVLMVWEDVHWIDPTSRELLDLVIERVQTLPVLLAITFRPEFAPPWAGQAHVTSLQLARLGRRETAALVARVAGDQPLPTELLDQLVTRSDGVPLFAEELTKAVLESGLVKETDRDARTGRQPSVAVPTTLQASLMARLDRLGPAREVAQIGAAIGRDFSYELLAAIAGLSDPALEQTLSQLAEAELVFVRGQPPEAVYSFKHVLVQDAAYGSLLRDKRRQLHRKIAEAVERQTPEIASARPELLARHWTEGGFPERAVPLWLEAGRLAVARSTLKEAATHLGRGLALLASLPEGPDRDRMELSLQTTLGSALINLRGYAAEETGRAFARARELCLALGDREQLFPVLFGHWVVQLLRGGTKELELAEELLRLAESVGDAESRAAAHRAMGITLFCMGRLIEACDHLERTLALLDEAQAPTSPLTWYPFDPRAATLNHYAVALGLCGYLDRARMHSREALARARQLHHLGTLVQGLSLAAIVQRLTRNTAAVAELGEELVSLAAEQGLPMWLGYGYAARGWALGEAGCAEEGITAVSEGINLLRHAGAGRVLANFHLLASQLYIQAGRVTEAPAVAEEGLRLASAHHDHWVAADLHRSRGEALRLMGLVEDAERAFGEAIQVARQQDARLWELRASMSLARLWRDQGKRTEARDLLTPVYGWFTEGFDTPDLKDAKALLDELGK
jgi:predicted ATPase